MDGRPAADRLVPAPRRADYIIEAVIPKAAITRVANVVDFTPTLITVPVLVDVAGNTGIGPEEADTILPGVDKIG